MIVLLAETGYAKLSVAAVCTRAQVSRRTFFAEFESLHNCLLQVMDEGLAQSKALITQAFVASQSGDREGGGPTSGFVAVREALVALLSVMDQRPQLARVWLLESLTAGSEALEHRERNITALIDHVLQCAGATPGVAEELVAPGVMASVLGLLQRHLAARRSEPLISLLGPLVGVVCRPYLSSDQIAEQVERAEAHAKKLLSEYRPVSSPALSAGNGSRPPGVPQAWERDDDLPALLRNPRAHRARACLIQLSRQPGVSNRQLADAIGITSHTQASTLFNHLERAGLLRRNQSRPGSRNEWFLTPAGERVAVVLATE